MIVQKRLLPTNPSRLRGLVLLCCMMMLYLFENSRFKTLIPSNTFGTFINAALWLGLVYFVQTFPRIRPKARLKHMSFLTLWAFNFAIIYILLLIGAGLIDGFGKSPYSRTLFGMFTNVFSVGSVLIAKELIRSYVVNNLTKQENHLLFVVLALITTGTSLSINRFTRIHSFPGWVEFIAQYIAPTFCRDFLATYLAFLGGPLPPIIYIGMLEGFHWLMPILPDLKWITTAFIGILCPIFCFMSMQSMYEKTAKKVKRKDQSQESPFSWIITSLISIGIIWFAVGVFPVYPSVIATGSMEPMIYPGDVILVQKISGNDMNIEDVIQFERDGVLISHRIIEIVEENREKHYRTKGDNNSAEDRTLVAPAQVKGKVIHVVPKIGWPTLLFKNPKDISLEDIVF